MNRTILSVIFCSAFTLLLVIAAEAASLHVEKGEILLSRGAGYRIVTASRHLDVGDTVVARAGSAAKISFGDGCSVDVVSAMVFTVETVSPCRSNVTNLQTGGATSDWVEATDAVAGGDWSATTQTVAVEASGSNMVPYLLGAAAIGGIAAVASMIDSGGEGAPISP